MRVLTSLLLLSLFIGCEPGGKLTKRTSSLNGNWTFKKEGDTATYAATVPGVIHLDLLANDLIDDPFWEDNELKQRWIEEENWVYEATFEVERKTLRNENVELIFEGLDTYAEVFLNGSKVLEADNMFRTWRVDAKPFLKKGSNDMRIVFQSPINKNRERVATHPYELPSGNEAENIPVKVYPFTRKAAYQFGWDWGPRFLTMGIWKEIKIETWNKVRIHSVFTETLSADRENAKMRTVMEVEVSEAGTYEFLFKQNTKVVKLQAGKNQVVHHFDIHNPKLWRINGKGKASLYDQKIRLRVDKILLDSLTDTFGVRTIELVNQPDSIGTSFYFELNGKPVFMKGANYIPQDIFLSRVSPEQYETLILAAKEANMNMLRVWGGGVYEKDLFYKLCDENGILVWQDFMFANSIYPADEDFRENIGQEVVENIKRLRSHPCLAIWCGNNEIEVAWKNWGWQEQYAYSAEDSAVLWENYRSIFHELIPDLVKQYHPQAAYTPTSPLSNWGTAENFNHGTMHYWGVWHGREPFENFETNVGRFMVEYGFQSYPEMSTLQKVIADSNLVMNSPMIAHRQKSYIGNGLISEHINRYFESPESFADFVELSQKTQALGMKMAIEAHLADQPHCMGSLFWQLNDCWPGPSWSVIDYYGKKKEAYATVREAFR